MENINTSDETATKTDQSPSSAPNSNWHDRYGYRHHFFLPKLILIVLVIFLAFMFGVMVSGRRPINNGFIQAERLNNQAFRQNMGGRAMMGVGRRHIGQRLLGSVTAINGNNLTVHNSTTDQTVVISSTTSIYKAEDIAKQTDLKVGDVISVVGQPNSSGNIVAMRIEID